MKKNDIIYYKNRIKNMPFSEITNGVFKNNKNKKQIINFLDEIYIDNYNIMFVNIINKLNYEELDSKKSKYFISLYYNNSIHIDECMNINIYNKHKFSIEKRNIKDYKTRIFYKYSRHNIFISPNNYDYSNYLIKNFFFKSEQEANKFIILYKILF